jgi:Spy/CpxP family protein refolding chaperone
MRKYILLSLAVLVAPCLAAQQRDSMSAPSDTAEAGRLRAQIEQRFSDRVQQDLKLSPDQATKLRATQERYGARRRTLLQEQLERRRAIDDQMQPGVAANSDSLRKLLDAQRTGRAEMVKIEQDEDREMSSYLTPLQQARYQQMRARLMQRVAEMRFERREGRINRGMNVPRPRPRGGRRGPGI